MLGATAVQLGAAFEYRKLFDPLFYLPDQAFLSAMAGSVFCEWPGTSSTAKNMPMIRMNIGQI